MKGLICWVGGVGLLALATLAGCVKEEDDLPESQVIVEAFIYEGELVNHVKVWEEGNGNQEDTPITDAQVVLQSNQQEVQLEPNPQRPGYYHDPEGAMLIEAGETYSLFIQLANGRTISGQTTVPEWPNVDWSQTPDSIAVNPAEPAQVVGSMAWPQSDKPALLLDRVVVDHGELEFFSPEYDEIAALKPFDRVLHDTLLTIHAGFFEKRGHHELMLTYLQPEYAQFFAPLNSSFEDQNINGNLSNAFGVFVAFNGNVKTVIVY